MVVSTTLTAGACDPALTMKDLRARTAAGDYPRVPDLAILLDNWVVVSMKV